jgi:hypothetical protein
MQWRRRLVVGRGLDRSARRSRGRSRWADLPPPTGAEPVRAPRRLAERRERIVTIETCPCRIGRVRPPADSWLRDEGEPSSALFPVHGLQPRPWGAVMDRPLATVGSVRRFSPAVQRLVAAPRCARSSGDPWLPPSAASASYRRRARGPAEAETGQAGCSAQQRCLTRRPVTVRAIRERGPICSLQSGGSPRRSPSVRSCCGWWCRGSKRGACGGGPG